MTQAIRCGLRVDSCKLHALICLHALLRKAHHGVFGQVCDVKQKIETSQGAEFASAQQVIIYQGKVSHSRRLQILLAGQPS